MSSQHAALLDASPLVTLFAFARDLRYVAASVPCRRPATGGVFLATPPPSGDLGHSHLVMVPKVLHTT